MSPNLTTESATTNYCATLDDVIAASKRIDGIAHRTPVLTSKYVNKQCAGGIPRSLFFKVEAMQRTGSFKFRGALNAILSHLESEHCLGNGNNKVTNAGDAEESTRCDEDDDDDDILNVITHSSGNHAAAVALASKLAGSRTEGKYSAVEATIVMPRNAPDIKKQAVLGYGGTIVEVDNTNEAREDMAECLAREDGAIFVHPSEDPRVIAGQGTVSLEMVEQVEDMSGGCCLDAVVIPVGGGGLASGNTIALRGLLGEKVKIILAEPKELDDAKRSKDAGELLGHAKDNKLNSVADGLKTTLGPNTWPIVRDLVDDIITVSENDILRATRLVWEKLKICIEPSAGVGVAVVVGEEFAAKYPKEAGINNVGVILCGGNVDILKISDLMKNI